MGRPTKYSEEMLRKAEEYLASYDNDGSVIPHVAGLALHLDVSKKTIYNWGEEHKDFLHTLNKLQQRQESILLANGLRGDFNAAITKLALANHGYTEKSEQTVQGPDGGAVQIAFNPVSNGRRSQD